MIVACANCGCQVHLSVTLYQVANGRWFCDLCWATRTTSIDEWQCSKCRTVLAKVYLKDRFGVVTCGDCLSPPRKAAVNG